MRYQLAPTTLEIFRERAFNYLMRALKDPHSTTLGFTRDALELFYLCEKKLKKDADPGYPRDADEE